MASHATRILPLLEKAKLEATQADKRIKEEQQREDKKKQEREEQIGWRQV